jgi:hypothetical protein
MRKARGKVKSLPTGFCYLIGGTTERPGLGRYTRAASAHMQPRRPHARPPALAASGDALRPEV